MLSITFLDRGIECLFPVFSCTSLQLRTSKPTYLKVMSRVGSCMYFPETIAREFVSEYDRPVIISFIDKREYVNIRRHSSTINLQL